MGMGSVRHYRKTCMPCAFLWTRGCENGVACPFCHLCDKGERKRRQKHRAALREEKKRCEA